MLVCMYAQQIYNTMYVYMYFRDITKGKITLRGTVNFSSYTTHSHSITCICHPPTYLNKIIIGFSNGEMQLWNIRTRKRVFCFFPNKNNTTTQKNIHTNTHISTPIHTHIHTNESKKHALKVAAITTIVPSTALDVVGIGLSNGECLIHNLKYDETIMRFTQNEGTITAMAFRSGTVSYRYAYIHTYIHTYTHTHTYVHTYIHTCIHTYIHAYIRTYTHTNRECNTAVRSCSCSCVYVCLYICI